MDVKDKAVNELRMMRIERKGRTCHEIIKSDTRLSKCKLYLNFGNKRAKKRTQSV